MDHEASLLAQLAERPAERALRLVLADALLERGDPRGEVIALNERGELSLTEQRKVARITAQYGAEWLGKAAAIADLNRSRIVGGFLDELVCVPRPAELFKAATGEPALCTVRRLALPPNAGVSELHEFVGHRVWRQLERLELGVSDLRALAEHPLPELNPRWVVLASYGIFARDLRGLERVPVVARARALGLATTEFTNSPTVRAIVEAVEQQLDSLTHFEELQLNSLYGPMEASVTWLSYADTIGRQLPRLAVWGIEVADVSFSLRRTEDGRFGALMIDLSRPEGQGERQAVSGDRGRAPIVVRLGNAAVVMQQLRDARLESVEIKLPGQGKLRSQERHALFAEARRWSSLRRFTLGGETTFLP